MTWPLVLASTHGRLTIPDAGHFGIQVFDGEEALRDELLAGAHALLGNGAVGWVPATGGLLSNLPAWENVLLSTQWHAPASLPALEARLVAWCARLGYDEAGTGRLLAQAPASLDEDERRLVGWLRQLLVRPRLVLCETEAFPGGAPGRALRDLLADELAGAALLVVDAELPAGFQPLSFAPAEVAAP